MPNSSGYNQYRAKLAPPDAELQQDLFLWQRLGYTISEQLQMLIDTYQYKISERTFRRVRERLAIPTSNYTRKMDEEDLTERIKSVIGIGGEDAFRESGSQDSAGLGVRRTRDHLAAETGLIVSHHLVRAKLREVDPLGMVHRWPGSRKIYRAVLQSIGWADEWSGDGHEKLSSRGLKINSEIGFEIYGIRDKFTGAFVALDCMPNARHRPSVGHVYLNAIEREGGCPRKLVVDCGTETNDAIQAQISFRSYFAPELDSVEYPPFARIKSVHNTVIEAAWSKFGLAEGTVLKALIRSRASEVDFDDALQVSLFRWIWSQIIQDRLDTYVNVHNYARVRRQPKKMMPSGHRPIRAKYGENGGEDCLVPVHPEAIQQVRSTLEPALRFVDEECEAIFTEVFRDLSLDSLTRGNGWSSFFLMLEKLNQ